MIREATSNYARRLRKPLEDRSALGIGVLTVAGLAIAMVVALWVTSAGIGKVSYDAEFTQAAGVSAGDAVTIAGVPVGTVDGVRLAGDHVVVTMQIDEGVSSKTNLNEATGHSQIVRHCPSADTCHRPCQHR